MENLSEKEINDIAFYAINPNIDNGEKHRNNPKFLDAELFESVVEDIKEILEGYLDHSNGLDSPEIIIGKALDYIKRLKRL